MAEVGTGDWYNPATGDWETVSGVFCFCWDCTYDPCRYLHGHNDSGTFHTKKQYRLHLTERRQAYLAWKENNIRVKQAKLAHTKETEAVGVDIGHLPPTVPTFFDIDTGSLVDPIDKRAYRWKLKRLSIQ